MFARFFRPAKASLVRRSATVITSLALLGVFSPPATCEATLVINVNEVGPDVTAIFSGSVDLTGLTLSFTGTGPGFVRGSTPALRSGSISLFSPNQLYTGVTSFPTSMGPGTGNFNADSATGDLGLGVLNGGRVFIPSGYVSGSPLAATTTWTGQTFASLGLTPGTYTWAWAADSVVVNIGAATVGAIIPEPATASLALLGLGGLMMRRRRMA